MKYVTLSNITAKQLRIYDFNLYKFKHHNVFLPNIEVPANTSYVGTNNLLNAHVHLL